MELDVKLNFLANSGTSSDANTQNLKTGANEGNKSFESTLHSKRVEAENEKKSAASETDKAKDSRKPKEKARKSEKAVKENAENGEAKKAEREEKPEAASEKQPVEQAESVRENEKAPEVGQVSAEVTQPTLTDEQQAQVVAQIAEALGVTPEQVAEALEKLEILPEELAIPENMNKLVMEVKGMKEPAELLTEPEMAQTLKNLRKIMSDALLEANNTDNERIVSEKSVETQVTQDVQVQSTETAAAENVEAGDKAQKQAQNKTITPEEETGEKVKPETTRTENRERVAGYEPQNTGTKREQSFGGNEKREASADETQIAPVVIQKGDETVIEVGGRTISRSVMRPMTQGADVVNQIISKMRIDFKPGQTEIKINLSPEELGNVTIKLVSEKGVVTAEIVTENSKAKELVEQNLETLRESLKGQGVEVGGLSVSVGQQENEERMAQFMREKSKSQARMSQIIGRIAGEEEPEPVSYANEAETVGYTVDYSA